MGEDGSVVIGVDMNISDAEKELARLRKKVLSLDDSLRETDFRKSKLAEQSAEMAANLDAAKAKLYEMESAAQGVFSPEQINDQRNLVKTLQSEWDEIENEIDKCNKAIRDGNIELEYTKQRYAETAKNADQLRSNSQKSAQALQESADSANELADATHRADSFLDKFTKRIVGLAKRVFVFTLITKALRSMRDWLGKAVKTNAEATAAIARLKGALLTLAQPLVDVVIPAFTMLVSVLTALVGKIATLLSALFGKTAKQSAEAAKNLYDEQKALEGVGSAADDASGSLAGFDEINTIQTENQGGGGAGVAAEEIVPDFGWMDGITDRLSEIADLILLIGAGLSLWKLGQTLPGVLGQIATVLGGILMTVGGLLLFWNGLTDAWENGVDWLNLIEMIGGLAAAAFGLYTVFSVLAPALAPIVAGITLVVGGLAMLVTAFHDAMENGWNLQNTLLAIAGIVATGLGFAFITGSVIPAVVAAIAALLLAFTVVTGNGEELLTGIRNMLEGFADFFKGVFTGDLTLAIAGISKIFSGLALVFDSVILGIRDTFLSFLTWLDEKTGGKLHGIIEFTKQLFSAGFEFIRKIASDAFSALELIFSGLVQFISGVFTGDWDSAWQGVKNIFKGAWNGIVSLLEGAVNLIIDGINWMISQLNKVSFSVPDWVPAIGGKRFGFNIPNVSRISIPRLARGAVIPPNREFMAVLGDQKSGTNVEAPLDTIKQALIEALAESGGSGGDIHITLELDGTVLARKVVSRVNDMTRAAGKPVLLY